MDFAIMSYVGLDFLGEGSLSLTMGEAAFEAGKQAISRLPANGDAKTGTFAPVLIKPGYAIENRYLSSNSSSGVLDWC